MSEYLGDILIPEIVASGTFPIVSDYGYGLAEQLQVVVHQFGSANAKIEQRFLLGTGAKRFTVRRAHMSDAGRIALRDFWENKYGPYGVFTYNAPNDDGNGTTAYTCRFANEPLTWELLADAISSIGVTLIEIPSSSPTYTVNSTVTRFPSSTLKTGLLSQVQEIIPLIKIQVRETGYPAIYVSDRRCTVGGQLYLARLLEFDGISQSIGNEADQANFTFGNADRVMRDLANDTNLFRASIEFSLFHVGTGIKLDLWKGEIVDWKLDSGPEFQVTAVDGIYELTLPYPARKISRTCWKCFDDGNGCPFTAHSSGLDTTHFPNVDDEACDKGYDTANGCLAHGMKLYFGGVIAEPQGVRIKDNSTGTLGFGRSSITSVSIVADSIYDQVVPEIYTSLESYKDSSGVIRQGRLVNCKVAAGRAEIDFYDALGIVGEGPLTLADAGHTLDNQYNHGYPGISGLRTVQGTDPAVSDYDTFSLGQAGGAGGDWRKNSTGGKDNFAAGLAFLELRRKDQGSLQLSNPSDHQMQALVLSGLQGWVWSAAGSRTWQTLTNPIWIVVNMMLRARGLRYSSAATAEGYFDVASAIAAAAICNLSVDVLVGIGAGSCTISTDGDTGEIQCTIDGLNSYPVGQSLTIAGNNYYIQSSTRGYCVLSSSPGDGAYAFTIKETQFRFTGIMQDEKPLRDWIQEVLMNCLGYYSFAFGKLKLGIRENSSVVEAFTDGNILFRSLQLSPLRPSFNHLTANFADGEFNFAANSVTVYDVDHAKLIGGSTAPLFLKSNMNLSGVSAKSQAARIISTRLREELGGTTADQWKAARQLGFRTTVLALNTEPGMVCSMTHADMPTGVGEFRVSGWKLNRDYSIEIQGQTTVDEMYDLTVGPKPADVVADPVPVEAVPLGSVGEITLTELFMQDDVNPDIYHRAIKASFGIPPVTYDDSFSSPTLVSDIAASRSGGSIPDNTEVYIEICPEFLGREGLPSDTLFINVGGTGGNTNKFYLTCRLPAEAEAYIVRIGSYPGRLYKHSSAASPGIAPFTITITSIASLDSSSLSPCPRFDHARVFYKYNTSANIIDAGKTSTPTQDQFDFSPEKPSPDDTTITVYVVSMNALESIAYPFESAPHASLVLTRDTGNPSGCSNAVILTNADDPTIPRSCMAFQFNRDTLNYQSIYAVEVMLAESGLSVGEGPYAAQRSAHAARVHESGSGLHIDAGSHWVTLATGGADRSGKVLLIFLSGDYGLDGQIIKSWYSDHIILTTPFYKTGTFNWAIVDRWFDVGTSESGNAWEHTFWVPKDMISCGDPTVWKTKPVPMLEGAWYAQVYTRNKYGVSQ